MPEETRDQRANRLLGLGMQVAARIREEGPDDVARLLTGLSPAELRDMVILVAAAVPVEAPISALLGWYTHPRSVPAPCGSMAAVRRHQAHHEDLDPLCEAVGREAERVRGRERTAARRQAA